MEGKRLNPIDTSLVHACSINHIRDMNLKSLIARKKLHLVLDLDNTLLQSRAIRNLTPYDREYFERPGTQRWLEEGKLIRWGKGKDQWLTKLRPNIRNFLEEASKLFDFSIFTLGDRTYAKKMLDILDPKGLYFAHSDVITKEDCITPMKKGLNLVSSHDKVILIVDDIEEFWDNDSKNLIKIAPYEFFDDDKRSWSRRFADESEKYGELARVLRELKKIHREFYSTEKGDMEGLHYESRDVRKARDEVQRKFQMIGTVTGKEMKLILISLGYK